MIRIGVAGCVAVVFLVGCGVTTQQAATVTGLTTTTTSSIIGKKVLDRYHGPTLRELLSRAGRRGADSIVAAVYYALLKKDPGSLSAPERVVLGVEALEEEVNSDGYLSFFSYEPSYVREIVAALKQIHCPHTARITEDAEAVLGIRPDWTADQISTAADDASDDAWAKLDRLDDRFYAYPDPLDDRLLSFIRAHAADIKL